MDTFLNNREAPNGRFAELFAQIMEEQRAEAEQRRLELAARTIPMPAVMPGIRPNQATPITPSSYFQPPSTRNRGTVMRTHDLLPEGTEMADGTRGASYSSVQDPSGSSNSFSAALNF